jgi:hypothetical protein
MAKILVSLDEQLLARVDRAARSRGLTRSAYLAGIASGELGAAPGLGKAPSVRRALRALDRLFQSNITQEDSVRYIREERDSH